MPETGGARKDCDRQVECQLQDGRHSQRPFTEDQERARQPDMSRCLQLPTLARLARHARAMLDRADVARLWMMHSMKHSRSLASRRTTLTASASSASVRTCGTPGVQRQAGAWRADFSPGQELAEWLRRRRQSPRMVCAAQLGDPPAWRTAGPAHSAWPAPGPRSPSS